MAITFYDIQNFERPDTSYPEYDHYFYDPDDLWEAEDEDDMYYGYDDFDEEFELVDEEDIDAIVDEYCGSKADAVVDTYWKMGQPDDEYMQKVRERWLR